MEFIEEAIITGMGSTFYIWPEKRFREFIERRRSKKTADVP
jgi:DNA-binding transcriptional regulator/RsmH inhibitor MraZ